jgi:hypothetical protein
MSRGRSNRSSRNKSSIVLPPLLLTEMHVRVEQCCKSEHGEKQQEEQA